MGRVRNVLARRWEVRWTYCEVCDMKGANLKQVFGCALAKPHKKRFWSKRTATEWMLVNWWRDSDLFDLKQKEIKVG